MGPFAQIAGVVHAAIGGGVDFDHVQRGVPSPDPPAARAASARLAVRASLRTIERHGQHAGQGGLAHTAGAAEEVGVSDPLPLETARRSVSETCS